MVDNLSKLTLDGRFCTNTFSSDLGCVALGTGAGGGVGRGEIIIGWGISPPGLIGMDVRVGDGLC